VAFDFKGTFTRSQFDRFSTFVRAQTSTIDARIAHLKAEQARIGNLAFAFDAGGVPTQMSADPPTSTYVGKLFGVYEGLGGDAEFDLQVRSTGQAIFRATGDETKTPQQMSNGDVLGTPGLSDAQTADSMGQATAWAQDILIYRREALERKIRRAIDYGDQLQVEINTLNRIKADATINGALEFILNGINALISDRQYLAASNDSSKPDPHGKLAYAPFAAYMPGPDRSEVTDFERTLDGPAVPKGTGT